MIKGLSGNEAERLPANPAALTRRRWRRVVGLLAPGAAVLAVHGTNLRYPLFYDDYFWLAVSDHHGWLTAVLIPGKGPSIYRPGLALWFAGMRAMFGTSALPYHLVALVFLIAAALAVRWLGLELGLGNPAATVAGALYGAFAPLALTTMWASAAGSSLAVTFAVASIALVCRPSGRRHLWAAFLLGAAILVRDATVVAPAAATFVVAARWSGRPRPALILRRTWGLWFVAGVFLTIRMYMGLLGSNSGPYAVDFFGGDVVRNLRDLMLLVSRLGLQSGIPDAIDNWVLRAWDVIAWVTVFGAVGWALRRHNYLPLAGVGWFFVSLSPVLILPNHGMAPYYLDLGAVGLALTIGSLASMARIPPAAMAVGVGVFALVNAGAVLDFQRYGFMTTIVERTEVLEHIAMTERPRAGELVVATHCPEDRVWSRDGDLFRVLQNEPDLRVRFEVIEPETCR